MSPEGGPWLKASLPLLIIVFGVGLFLGGGFFLQPFFKGYQTSSSPYLFASAFPVSPEIKAELSLLRENAKLSEANELAISHAISTTSTGLNIPPAVLWCLLFQESRLNHLEGIEQTKAASGIGQFSYFSFYEVNHHLDRFTEDNKDFILRWYGKDIRPIGPNTDALTHPSSYYFIPTGVAASATYLNNRYHHLAQILERNGITYDKDLLWVYASMAYNKGTRSILALWNTAQKWGGIKQLTQLVSDYRFFNTAIESSRLMERSLAEIWGKNQAPTYASELKVHIKNIQRCAISPEVVSANENMVSP